MKKIKYLIPLFIIILLFAASYANELAIKNKGEKKLEQVTMTIKENTLSSKGASIIITDLNSEELHSYDTAFRIDKKENGKWITLEDKEGEIYVAGVGLEVNEDHILEQEINWQSKYGELPKGDYRLVKEADILHSKGPAPDIAVVYAEFSIK